jgi:hypothetical protein
MLTRLLFPGRHHLLTNFQLQYLTRVTSADPTTLLDVNGEPLPADAKFQNVIWAMTSANHENTRRNPLPGHRREAAIEELADLLDVESFVYLIDDIGTSERYASYVLHKIEVDSFGRFRLTPENTVVACSTPIVIAMYEKLGFRILPCELANRAKEEFLAETPWELVQHLVKVGLAGRDWRTDPKFVSDVARATRRLYQKYNYGDAIVELFRRPILTEDGDPTATRDYNTYARAFDNGAQRKYQLIRDHVVPGRIVDIGCCTGSVLAELTRDDRLREADFYGIEVARHLYAECQHRKQQGAFANDHVFFYQRDFAAGPIFASNSVNTFTTFSLTHEVESYSGRDSLHRFIGLLFDQLAPRGRWLNCDVVGPDELDALVWMRLNRSDGRNDDWQREFAADQRDEMKAYLDGLSTQAKFLRFAQDFRHVEGYRLAFEQHARDGEAFVELRLADACDFLSKKDYTDNWLSEMHETFCYWSFADWRAAVSHAGFRVHPASRAYVNPWLVENRYRGKADLFDLSDGKLVPREYPVTNMLLIAEK